MAANQARRRADGLHRRRGARSRSTRVAKLRDRETSRRWQAHYDLIRGRLLAMKIRCYEYNWACARMKKDAPKFTEARRPTPGGSSPTTEIQYSDKAAAAAKRGQDAAEAGHRRAPRHPLGPAGPARAEGPVRLQVGRDQRPARSARNDNDAEAAARRSRRQARRPSRRNRPKL